MKSVFALFSISVVAGTAHHSFLDSLGSHQLLPAPAMARLRAQAVPALHLVDVVRLTAHKHGVQNSLVQSIIKAESSFRTDAVSPKGAQGLMQLMPETAQEYGVVDPKSPEQNIDAGTKYLGWLLKRYEGRKNALPMAIAAYNAGPGNVDRYKGIPPFPETKTYVARVMNYQREIDGVLSGVVPSPFRLDRKLTPMAVLRRAGRG